MGSLDLALLATARSAADLAVCYALFPELLPPVGTPLRKFPAPVLSLHLKRKHQTPLPTNKPDQVPLISNKKRKRILTNRRMVRPTCAATTATSVIPPPSAQQIVASRTQSSHPVVAAVFTPEIVDDSIDWDAWSDQVTRELDPFEEDQDQPLSQMSRTEGVEGLITIAMAARTQPL